MVEVDADGYALYLADSRGQLVKALIELYVILGLRKLAYVFLEHNEGAAAEFYVRGKSLMQDLDARDVKLYLGNTCKIVVRLRALGFKLTKLGYIVEYGDEL